ncbi:type VI secretion system ImpA family N-terminal domain-containing protein [Caballeronia fortuita]
MFSNLLNALFGTRQPSGLAIEALPQWDEWLVPIRADSPVGDDPGYDDDFLAIKDEVAKLSNVDDALIVESAERLIRGRAKDVRLAVYYVYGRLRRDGAEGVKSRINRKDADKPALSVRIDSLTADLTAIDAARAVALT